MYCIGVDHHKQYSLMTVLDGEGREVKTGRMTNTRADIGEFLRGLEGEAKAVIEAGRASFEMAELLEDMGIDVTVAHAAKVKAIASARIKTDKRDARVLADLLRAGLIPAVYQRGGENREAQRVLRLRAFFVKQQTQVKNKIYGLLAHQGEEVRQAAERIRDLFTAKGLEALERLALGGKDQEILQALVKACRHLAALVKESDGLVRELYGELETARLIDTVPGFGVTLAVLVAVEIADIGRFRRASELHSYAGLIPSTYSSGDRTYHGRITKQGNGWLRWALVEAVYPAIKVDHDLRVYYQKIARRKGANVAKVATARRLLTVIHKMLKEGRAYVLYPREKTSAA